MKNTKFGRLCALVLVLVMVLSMVPFSFAAEEEACAHANKTYVEATDPTCTEDGNWDYYTCDDCDAYIDYDGETLITAEQIAEGYLVKMADGHQWRQNYVEGVAATCTKDGVWAHSTCTKCNATIIRDDNGEWIEATEEETIILAHGHDTKSEYIEAKKPTCTEAGNYAYKLCGTCGAYLVEEDGKWVEKTRNDVYLEPLGHSRKSEFHEYKAPTCTEAGNYAYYLCATCGEYYDIEIDAEGNGSYVALTQEEVLLIATGHDRKSEYVEYKKPTCTEAGNYAYYLCGTCGAYFDIDEENGQYIELSQEEIYLAPTGHDRKSEHVDHKDATCDEAGNYEYYLCGVCGAYYDIEIDAEGNGAYVELNFPEDIVILPYGHDTKAEYFETKAPTCTEAGNYHYYLCGKCGAYLQKDYEAQQWVEVTREDIVILPLGHSKKSEYTEYKAPSCTEAGNYAYYLCNTCGGYFDIDEENGEYVELTREEVLLIPFGHSKHSEHFDAKEATCTEAGNYEYYVCATCGEYYNIVIDEEGNGSYVELTREDVVILPIGHERPEYVEAKRATCDEPGNYEYWLCGKCGCYMLKDNEAEQWVIIDREDILILPIGHERLEHVEAVRATCDQAGNYEYWYCNACSKYLSSKGPDAIELKFPEDIVDQPIGHERIQFVEAVRATCDQAGNYAYWYCDACSRYFEDREATTELKFPEDIVDQPIGHERIEFVEAVRATCTEAGNYEYWWCNACSRYFADREATEELFFPEDIVDQPLGHSTKSEYHEAVRPTCDTAGNHAYWWCITCGAYFVKNEDGSTTDLKFPEDIVVTPMAHERPEKFEAKRATCTEAGNIEYYLCGQCGKYLLKDNENQQWVETTREEVVILPLGHERPELIEATRATCDEPGNIQYWLCGGCGAYLLKDNENQQWVEVTREEILVLPLGHERLEKVEAVRATCTEAGNIEYWYCNACSKYLSSKGPDAEELKFPEDIVVLPIGHERPEKIEAIKPTCTEAGNYEYYLCGGCGAYLLKDNENQEWVEVTREDIVILAMGHERPELIEAKPATCDEPGNIQYWLCGGCGAYLLKDNEAQEWVVVSREEILVLPLGHERLEKVEAVRATCTEAGNIEYWWCNACGKYLSEKGPDAVELKFPEDIVILPIGHERPEKIEALRPTCTEAGNYEYYLCGGCGAYLLKDEENQAWVETTREEIVILPIGHERPTFVEAVKPTTDKEGVKAHWYCEICGKYLLQGEQGWIEVDYSDLIVPKAETPATGDNFALVAMVALTVMSIMGIATVVVLKRKARA